MFQISTSLNKQRHRVLSLNNLLNFCCSSLQSELHSLCHLTINDYLQLFCSKCLQMILVFPSFKIFGLKFMFCDSDNQYFFALQQLPLCSLLFSLQTSKQERKYEFFSLPSTFSCFYDLVCVCTGGRQSSHDCLVYLESGQCSLWGLL